MVKQRILLADDHEVVRAGLKTLVGEQPDMEVVGEAGDGLTALQESIALRPDIVVMDVSMPGLSGAEVTDRLKQSVPDVKVLALTVHEDKGYLHRLLQAGASGYVLKRAASVELIHAIRVVAAGRVYIDPTLAGRLVGDLVRRKPARGTAEGEVLSEREIEVVKLVAMGFNNREIAGQLDISVKTVETHKTHALEKLGLHSRAGLVRYALHRGWLQDA
jgi:DNA-binding NarL/FixJ family response regulator